MPSSVPAPAEVLREAEQAKPGDPTKVTKGAQATKAVEANATADVKKTENDAANAQTKTQIVDLLTKAVDPSPAQTPKLGSLVGEFADKFGNAAKKSAGLSAVLKQQAQTLLMNQFSSGLGKILKPDQLTKFNAIKNQVLPLFAAIR